MALSGCCALALVYIVARPIPDFEAAYTDMGTAP